MTGASEPEGCALACARGLVGSHKEDWVDLNWNKTVSQDERVQHSLAGEGSVVEGVMDVTGQRGYAPAGLGGRPRGGSDRSLCELPHVATWAVCLHFMDSSVKGGCPWHHAHGGPAANHREKCVGSIVF